MTQLRTLIAMGAALLTSEAALGNDIHGYPRLAGVNMGGPHNYDDPAYQAKLAKLDMSVLNMWPGWETTRSMTMDQVVRNIKALNPKSKVFLYHISMEVADDNASTESYRAYVDKNKWWAYPANLSGSRILSTFGAREDKPVHVINTTLHTSKDSNGYQFWQWDARWTVNTFYKPNPSIDGFFEDNVFWKPRVDADWNKDGITDSQSSANAGKWLREGYQKRFELMRQLMPGKHQIGNIADWGHKSAVLTELNGALNGGVIEGILGTSYAPEKWGSWTEMMRWYRKTMAAIAAPKFVVFHQQGSPTDYQALRYGLASCLLDDGYFAFTDAAKGYTGVVWFDEFDADLGKPVNGPSMTEWKNGVYRRDFENGIVLVNPKGNGAVEITLEEEFRRLTGKQAPGVNNGQLTKTVKLNDRDGIILKRKSPKTLPKAPVLH
jgi:hypothetical protein